MNQNCNIYKLLIFPHCMHLRPAVVKDAPAIHNLISRYPRQLMQTKLPKTKDFMVAEDKNMIVACCALEIYSPRMAEIRSLAVDTKYQGQGLATQLVQKCVQKAKQKGIDQVLAISSANKFFERLRFSTFQQEKYALLRKM